MEFMWRDCSGEEGLACPQLHNCLCAGPGTALTVRLFRPCEAIEVLQKADGDSCSLHTSLKEKFLLQARFSLLFGIHLYAVTHSSFGKMSSCSFSHVSSMQVDKYIFSGKRPMRLTHCFGNRVENCILPPQSLNVSFQLWLYFLLIFWIFVL